MWVRGALFVLLSTLSGALPAEAAPAVISVLVDADNDAESGCTAPGGATGFEQAFATTVDRTTLQVLTLERRQCTGNSFGDPVRLGGPWPATDGDEQTHVELRLPFTELPPRDVAKPMRLAFVFTDETGTTAFSTEPGGSPMLYPVATSARRRSARPADGTQFITIGGGIGDWSHVEPLFDRGLHTVFMIAGRGELYFRFDLRDGSQPPVAAGDAYSVPRGELLVVDAPGVLANDSDAEGSDLSAALAGPPAKGSVTLAPDGSFTYVHDGSTEPSDTFTYTVSDGLALSAPASVTINVSASNAPPVAVDDVFHVANGGALDVTAPGLFSNDLDSDTPQSQWTVAVVAGPSHGLLTVGTGGAFTYVHDGSAAGDSFTYQVDDGAALSNVATVTIVAGTNAPPVADDDFYTVAEGATLTIAAPGLLANDGDAEGDELAVSGATDPLHGTLAVQADGSFTYVHDGSEERDDTFRYGLSDGTNARTGTATIEVTEVNDDPVAADDVRTTGEDEPLTFPAAALLANDSAGPGETTQSVVFLSATNAVHGTVAVSDSNVTFTPAPDFHGTATFRYTIQDDGVTGAAADPRTASALVSIAVTPVNDAPAFTSAAVTEAVEDALYTYAIAAADADASDALSIAAVGLPAWLTLTDHGNGTATLSGTPLNAHAGSVAITLTVSDSTLSATQPFTLVVANANDAPVANDDAGAVTEDAATNTAAGNVLANDADIDAGDVLAVTPLSANGTYGSVTIAAGGTFTYTLDNSRPAVQALAQGATVADSFDYTVTDGSSADAGTLVITIAGANDAPAFTSTEDTSAPEDAPYTYVPTVEDADTGAALTVTSSALPAWLTFDGTTLSGTPANTDVGSHPVTLTVSDTMTTTTQAFTIVVTNTNDAPVANDDAGAVTEDAAANTATGNVLANDSDEDLGDAPAAVALNGTGMYGSVAIAADGTFTYTLDNALPAVQALADGATVTDTFEYTVDDGKGGTATATLTVTITGANDAPEFTSAEDTSAPEDAPYSYSVTVDDADAGAALTVTSSALPAWLTFDGTTLSGTPANGDVGSHPVTLTVSDTLTTATQTFTIVVTNTNDSPVASDDAGAVTEDAAANTATGNVLANDADVDAGDAPAVSPLVNATGTYGSISIAADGTFTYTLDNALPAVQALAQGATVTDSFSYTTDDGHGGTDSATLTITVTGANDAPAFTSTEETAAPEDAPYTYVPTVEDVDTGASLTVISSALPAWLTFDGTTLSGTPANADVGLHPVTLTVSDTISTAVQSFTIVVTNTNDAPVANDDAGAVTEDAAANTATGDVLSNDTDEDVGDTLAVNPLVNATGTYGSVTITANGAFTYTLDNSLPAVQALPQGATETDTFNYTTGDGEATDTATLTITVTGVNDAPVFTSTADTTAPEDALYSYTVATSDADTGAALTVTSSTLPAWLSFDGTTLAGTPANTDVGSYPVTLTVSDTITTATQTFTIVVSNTNDAPVANDDSGDVTEDAAATTATGNVLSNDTDEDLGDTLAVTPAVNATGTYGSVTIAANGAFTYTLDNSLPAVQALPQGVTETDVFNYTVDDGEATDTATLTVTVTGVNDAPVFTSTAVTTAPEDALYSYMVTTSDADSGAALTVTSSTLPAWLTFDGTTLTGTPANTDVGSYPVTLTVSDTITTAVQSFTIVVSNTNDAPVANDDAGAVTEDAAANTATGDVLSNDTDEDVGDTLAVNPTVGEAGTYGSVTIAANGAFTYTLDNSLPAVQALPQGATETDTFNYTVDDGEATDTATLTITVTGVNDAPVFTSTADTTAPEDALYSYTVTASDADTGAALTVTSSTLPAWLSFDGTTLTGTPGNADVGSYPVTLTLSDTITTAMQAFTIVVSNTNDTPVANDDAGAVTEDAAANTATGDVLSNDTDEDLGDTLAVNPLVNATGTYGSVTIAANGAFTYTLDNSLPAVQALPQGATEIDTFSYTTDDGEATATATLTITVTGANDAPVFTSTADTTAPEDALYTYTVTTSDADTGASLTVTSSALPAWLSFDGTTLTGTPANADVGSYPVTLTVSDAITTAVQSFTIVVSNTNDTPVANDDSGAVTEDAAANTANGDVLTNDTDEDVGDTLAVNPAVNATGTYGSVTIAANGAFTYTVDNSLPAVQALPQGATETDTFNYTVDDGEATDTATLTITVTGVNDAPVFTSTEDTTAPEDALYSYTVTTSDADTGASLTVTSSALPAWLSFDGTTLTGTPANADVGSYPVTLTVSDTITTATQAFTIVVSNTNDAPVANDDAGAVTEDAAANTSTGDVLSNDSDEDLGDTLAVNPLINATGTYGSVTIAANGAFTYTLDNSLPAVQVLAQGVTETDTFNYTVDDGEATDTATLTITVTGVNDAPVFTSTADTTAPEDALYSYTVTASDADTGAALTVTSSTLPAWLSFDGTTLTGTPANGDVGNYPVTLTLSDTISTATQAFTIVVSNTNDTPVANDDAGAVTEDAAANTATGDVLSNDTDEDLGDTLAVNPVVNATGTYGSVTIAANGAFTYTLDNSLPAVQALPQGATETDTFNYTVDDGQATDTATLTITVTGVNDAPVFTSTADTTAPEDALYSYTVTTSDADSRAALTVTSSTLPAWLTFDGTTLTGTPANGDVGSYPVTLTLSDTITTATQAFTIVISNTNDAPVANADAGTVTEDAATNTATGNVLANDVEVDAGDSLTVSPAVNANGTYGTAVIAANGAFTYTLDNTRAAVQALRGGHTVTDAFNYTAVDTTTLSSSSALTVTITGANDAPVAAADQYLLPPAGTLNGTTVLANDTDADSVPSVQTLTAVLVSDDTAQGNLTFETDGTFVYVKTCGPCAATVDTFTYRVNDGVASSNVVTVTIVFNTPPIPAGDAYTVLEDSGTTNVAAGAGLLANDTDADLDTLTVTGITYNAVSHAPGATIAMTRGTLVVNGDGSFAFTAAANAFGAESFSYQLSDGTAAASANATITITAVNDAPTFGTGGNVTVLEDAAQYDLPWAAAVSAGPGETQTLQFFATNSDPTRFLGGVAGDASSTATGITFTGTFGPPALRPNGNLTFRLAPNVNGAVTVSTYLRDNGATANGGADRSALPDPQFTINITPVNDAPSFEFSQPSITQREDENCACLQPLATFARTFTPGGGADELSQQLLQYTITADDPTFFTTLTIDPATGNLRMIPAANRYGKTTIRVRAQDNGGTANGGVDFLEKTYPVEYLPINDAPSFVKGPDVSAAAGTGAQTYPNWVVSASVGPANESAPPANTPPYTPQTINAYLVTVPAAQQALFAVQPAISTSGTLTFTPAASGSGNAVVSVQVRDSGASGVAGCCTNVNTSATQTFVITIGNVNAPPSFSTAGDQSVPEESAAQTVTNFITAVSPGPGASDAAQTVTFAISNNNNALFNVQPALVANGANYHLTYTPKPNTAGAATVTVTATDNGPVSPGVNSFARTFTITVTNVNDTPSFTIAANPPQSANDSGLQQVSSFATAINPGATHESTDVLTFVVTNNTSPSLFSAGPSISSAGALTYAAAPGQTGTATITVLLRDDGSTPGVAADDLSSPTQVFTINVVQYTGNVNDPPTFTKGADESVVEDSGARTVNPWATGISGGGDDTGQSVTFFVTGNTNTALFSTQPAISPAGVLTYTPTVNAFGSATVTVVARDDGGVLGGGINTSAPQSFTITVRPKNDAPTFTASNITVAPGSGAQSRSNWISAFSSGSANESQTVTFSMTWTSANPSLFTTQPVLTGRNLTFTPAPAQNGTAVLTVTAKDNGGVVDGGVDTTVQTYNLYIENANDAPSFTKGANVTSLEDAGPQSIANWATAVSPGPADEAAQNVTFQVTTNTNTALFSSAPALARTGNTATLTYTAAANAFGSATITLVAKDDGGTAFGGVDTSASQQFTITVTNVNDQPSFVIPASAPTVVKNAPAQTINNFASPISKGPTNEPDTLAFTLTNDSNAIFSVQPAINSSGALTYTPASNATGTATVSVVLKDNGGVANGGVDTSVTKTFTITISEPNSPPVVPNRTINTYTNMSVTIGATNTGYRLLDNITDVNPGSTFTLSGVSNVFSGARVDILDATLGTFKFTPALSQTGAQTFQYTVCDNGFSGFASQCATGTVTVTVSGPNIIFVDDDAPAGGNGTLDRPLQNLPFGLWDAQTTLFVYSGTYTRTATTYLGKATQIIGQGGSGSFDSTFGINPATLVAGSLPPRPSMAGTKPVVNYPTALTPPFQSQGPFWTDSAFNGSMTLKNFTVNSPSGTCFYVHSFNSTITVDNVTMNCRHALQLNNSNTVTITNSSLTADADGYGFYSLNTGGASPGSTVTLTNTPINSGRIYVYGNPFDLYTFNSAVNVSRLEVTGVTVTDGNRTAAVFNGPVTATSTTSGPTVRVENGRFNGTLTINATYPAYGLQVPDGGSVVATASNNSITAVNTHAIQLWNVNIPAAGVKFQTVNASGGFVAAQFWNVAGPGSVVISGGSMQPCVDIQSSPTVSVPGGTTLCP